VAGRRVDRIERRLRALGGRARLQQILEGIREEEGKPDVSYQSVYIAIQLENQRLDELGERTRFITSRDGEERVGSDCVRKATLRHAPVNWKSKSRTRTRASVETSASGFRE